MEVEVFRGKFFRVTTEELTSGARYERVYQRPGVTVLPVTDDGRIMFVRVVTITNPSPRIRTLSGYVENNEEPLECAKRELAEELGLVAEYWMLFTIAQSEGDGGLYKNQYIFVARNLRLFEGEVHKDPHEITSPAYFTFEEAKVRALQEEFGTREDGFALLRFLLEVGG